MEIYTDKNGIEKINSCILKSNFVRDSKIVKKLKIERYTDKKRNSKDKYMHFESKFCLHI